MFNRFKRSIRKIKEKENVNEKNSKNKNISNKDNTYQLIIPVKILPTIKNYFYDNKMWNILESSDGNCEMIDNVLCVNLMISNDEIDFNQLVNDLRSTDASFDISWEAKDNTKKIKILSTSS